MLTDSNRSHYSDMTPKASAYVTSNTLIETCKNVGLNVKEYFTYVFSRLIEGEKDYEKLLPSVVAR